MNRTLFSLVLIIFTNLSVAATLTVNDVSITRVQAYETANDSINVKLYVNGSGRVGPNPDNQTETCELWTSDSTVHSTAMTALVAGKKVSIRYIPRGDNVHFCQVNYLAIQSD
jgi:hypothetical protein